LPQNLFVHSSCNLSINVSAAGHLIDNNKTRWRWYSENEQLHKQVNTFVVVIVVAAVVVFPDFCYEYKMKLLKSTLL